MLNFDIIDLLHFLISLENLLNIPIEITKTGKLIHAKKKKLIETLKFARNAIDYHYKT